MFLLRRKIRGKDTTFSVMMVKIVIKMLPLPPF